MEARTRLLRSFAVVYLCALSFAGPTPLAGQSEPLNNSGRSDPVFLVIRTDDAGLTHSVNLALEKLIAKARNVQLLTYRQLISMQGLQSMRRPAG